MIEKYMLLFMSAFTLLSCVKEDLMSDDPHIADVSLSLSVNTLSVNDPMSIHHDQDFSSLAIYLYNNDAAFTLDKSALIPSFPATQAKVIPIQTQAGTKIIYMIANYAGKTFKLANGTAFTLSPTTTKQQLDHLITESNGGFSPSSLLMVGKRTLNMTAGDNGSAIDFTLRRLQARVDVHVYKGANFGSNVVSLESITFHNQVLNSEIQFDYDPSTAQMLASPMFQTQLVTNPSVLSPYTGSPLPQPGNAHASFYSFQNLVSVFSPIQVTAPYLEIKLNSNGNGYTYKGYLTDQYQTLNKYSLLQNNVYQVTAILDLDSKIVVNVTVLPWNQKEIEYERPITSNDFSFGAWGTSWGGLNGKTMNTNVGGLEDAVFLFELKAPAGAVWTATLTNGLDFTFPSATAGTSTPVVSKGFTNTGDPSIIAVRATKRWTGSSHETEFYITVEGNEIPINPIVGTQRKYEGTDTRIKIRQVASYN